MATTESSESARSLAIQSVIYLNDLTELQRAAAAACISAAAAKAAGVIGAWTYVLGDGSPKPLLGTEDIEHFASVAANAGGSFAYTFFGANLGHGGGHNRLALQGESDLLLFLNPDGILGPQAVSDLATAVSGDVGAADARQLPIEHAKEFDAVTGDTSWASGACLMTQSHVFSLAEGFDSETFFLYGDDVDYSWRVKLVGYRVVHCPSARLFHDKRLTVSSDWPATEAELRYSAEAALFLAHKFSRQDVLSSLLSTFTSRGDAHSLAAIETFETRRRAGELVSPIDPEHRIGQFVNGNYAIHRY
ncbi:hypothetical protein AB0O95_01415 [Rhodoglobus sp. NPDC076762]